VSTRHTPLLPLLAAATLLLLGCGGDSPTQPIDTGGTISFSYSGAISGSFSASGTLRLGSNQQPEFGSWAAGGRGPDNALVVTGLQPRTDQRGNAVALFVPAATGPATFPISPNCAFPDDMCPAVVLVTNALVTGTEPSFDRLCLVLTGSITVTAVSQERARGNFSGAGTCFDSQTATPTGLFLVTNGVFDVPLVPDLGLPAFARTAEAGPPADRAWGAANRISPRP
jgi:hypothetical protein